MALQYQKEVFGYMWEFNTSFYSDPECKKPITNIGEKENFYVKVEMTREEAPRFLKEPITIPINLKSVSYPSGKINKRVTKECTLSRVGNVNKGIIHLSKEDWE